MENFMAHKGLNEPHVLLASSNPQMLARNLAGILSKRQISKINAAVSIEVKRLFELGEVHFEFARSTEGRHWRQKISRLYYGAYNARRALILCVKGEFSTDSKDHQAVDQLPKNFQNNATYAIKLKNLREDRNLSDYSHLANEADLILPVLEAQAVVSDFFRDVKEFLQGRGISI
jgi:uncharacterized protein (UPF0332 family)